MTANAAGRPFVPRSAQTALRLPRDHVLSREGLRHFSGPAGRGGLVLGIDEDRRPVAVRILEGRPTVFAVVGPPSLARVIAFRAVAVGALIRVVTARPEVWRPVTESLGGYARLVSIAATDAEPSGGGSPAAPVLTVFDADPRALDVRRTPGPWTTRLILLPAVSDTTASTLRSADVALLPRCDQAQARRACALLGVEARHVPRLVYAPDDGLALVSRGEPTFLRMSLTEVERALLTD